MLELPLSETLSETQETDPTLLAQETQLATVCVVGLGYVGLPVAVEFGKQRPTLGFDMATKKVERLKQHHDATGEVSAEELRAARLLTVTDNPERIREADFI